jgi:hypothetical protein
VLGNASLYNCAFSNNTGGALWNLGAEGEVNMDLMNCTVSGNTGGGIKNEGFEGMANMDIEQSIVSGNQDGGIYNDANLTLAQSVVSGNTDAAGIYNFHFSLPGSAPTFATANIFRCVISNNVSAMANGFGGGIYNGDFSDNGAADVRLYQSQIIGNQAADGGGIYNRPDNGGGTARVEIVESTVAENRATNGGAVFNAGGQGYPLGGFATITISNSTLNGNTAVNQGGAIFNQGLYGTSDVNIFQSTLSGNAALLGPGGALFNVGLFGASESSATATIWNSTFNGNTADIGGSIINGGPAGATGTTDSFYGSGRLEIGSTILNADGPGGTLTNSTFGTYSAGLVVSDGFNLASDEGGDVLTNATDKIKTDPLLGPLQDNGGSTFPMHFCAAVPQLTRARTFPVR